MLILFSLLSKIRVITDRVYYVYKGIFTGKWISSCYKIPYGILFPDKRNGEKLGEIVQGYSKPPFFVRLFATRIWRPKYYKYFDSWELTPLPDLPKKYVVNPKTYNYSGWLFGYFHKSYILLRWQKQLKKLQNVRRMQDRFSSMF